MMMGTIRSIAKKDGLLGGLAEEGVAAGVVHESPSEAGYRRGQKWLIPNMDED